MKGGAGASGLLRSCAAFAVAAVLIALPTLRLWSPRFVLDGRDVHRIFRPAAYALEPRLKRLELPEWEPALACGQPLAGVGQSQLAYPPRWILVFAGPERTLSLLAVLHPLFAAACGFALARRLGAGRASAACAALVTGGTPLWLSAYVSPNLEYAAAWSPLALLGALRYGETLRLRGVALAGTAIGMQLLAGGVELAFGTGLCCAAVALMASAERARVLRGVGVMALLALLLGAPEWLPVAAHAREGPRHAGLSLSEASRWSFGAHDVAGLFAPSPPEQVSSLAAYKNQQELLDSVYVGAAALALAVLGAVAGRRRLWLPVAVGVLLLSLGKWGGLFAVLHLVPGLDRMRYPAKFALLLAPLLALGVAQGIETLGRIGRGWALVLAAGGAAVLLVADRRVGVGAAFALGLLAVAVVLRREYLAAPLALVAVGLELTVAASALRVVPIEPAATVERLRAEIPLLESRQRLGESLRDEDWWRLGQVATPPEVDAFALNFPQAAGLRLSDAYGPNLSLRVLELRERGGEGALDLMAERFSLVMGSPGNAIRRYGEAALVARERPLSRGVFLTRWRVLPAEDVRRRVLAPDFDPRSEVLLEADPGLPPSSGEPRASAAGLREPWPELIALSVTQSPEAGLLLLQDTWDPGWSAEVDGKPAAVLRADYAFMAVAVHAGSHEVVLRYACWPLRLGLMLAVVGLVIAVLLARRGRGNASAEAP